MAGQGVVIRNGFIGKAQVYLFLEAHREHAIPRQSQMLSSDLLQQISVSGNIQMSKWPLSLKGILAAHRGGYMELLQREKGPTPFLWRASDFLKWAERFKKYGKSYED